MDITTSTLPSFPNFDGNSDLREGNKDKIQTA